MNRAQRRVSAKISRQAADVRDAADALHRQGLIAYQAGRHAEAAELIGQAIRAGGENADYLCNLGVVLKAGGRPDAALEQFEQAIALDPRHMLAFGNRGNLEAQLSRLPEAAASYRAALALAPDSPGLENNLGNVLRQSGQAEEAVAAYRRALEVAPGYVEALGNLGSLLTSTGQLDAAADCLQRALALRPDDMAAHANLGRALCYRRDYLQAEQHYRAAIAINANFAVGHAGLGDVLAKLGRTDVAVQSYQAALKLKPGDPASLSALLFLRNYSSDATPAEMTATARAYGDAVCRGIPAFEPHANDPDPERRLRIGLVSGDFRSHAVSSFLRGVLPELGVERLDLVAYSTSVLRDRTTEELATMIGSWRNVADLDDTALCTAIRTDGIDILVDLSGHTLFNRLPAFARRPAPVQVSWLGYSGTTGVGAMEYILGDRWVTPETEAAQLAETPWRMPDSYLCFAPPASPVEVGPLPAGAEGPITFGSFNNVNKLSELTVAAWARVLDAVGDSRLLLKNRLLDDTNIATEIRARFAAHGVATEQLLLQGRDPTAQAHLQSYDLVDIALDPFPYNGTTTTVEALWMGVPVLGLKGGRFIAHVGESILHTVGLADWIAADIDDYVAKAAALAADRQALAALRQNLRPQLLASPLCDAPRFVRHLEATFREMWRLWCGRQEAQAAKGM